VLQTSIAVNGIDRLRQVLPSTALEAWHGLFAARPYYAPIVVGAVVGAVWFLACAGLARWLVARWLVTRRDVAG
jgi:ABC-2 type transport system permease protein